MGIIRALPSSKGRTRFLWDCNWLVIRAGMQWDRWGFIHENIERCHQYFDQRPSWVRAFRVHKLLHQMAGFTDHPDLLKERDYWMEKARELDKGELSDRDGSQDTVTHLQMGLSNRELRRIKWLCRGRPRWRWNPNASRIIQMVEQRLHA